MKNLLSQISHNPPSRRVRLLMTLLCTVMITYSAFPMDVYSTDNLYQIVFGSEREFSLGIGPAVHIMDADGSNIRLLPLNDHYNVSPACSPDGEYFAFLSDTLYGTVAKNYPV